MEEENQKINLANGLIMVTKFIMRQIYWAQGVSYFKPNFSVFCRSILKSNSIVLQISSLTNWTSQFDKFRIPTLTILSQI